MPKDMINVPFSNQSKTARKGKTLWRAYTAIRFRCRARRAFRTFRPFFVDMRLRKPWVRLRDTLLGWKVRFIGPTQAGKDGEF